MDYISEQGDEVGMKKDKWNYMIKMLSKENTF